MIYKIVRVFVNPCSVHDKHYVLNRDQLTPPIQMQLSEKQKKCSEFFLVFLMFILNFKLFPKKDDSHS